MAECVLSLPEGISGDTAEELQKYHYTEFAGWSGERYLKKLLRQILPGALYRTWEIFVDHQAQGNDCYLGVTHLAEIAGRNRRTMEKNLASLCAKHLLVERAERKLFRDADGRPQSRVVVVKDFSRLYTLAHEYHEWVHDTAYIAPDREMVALVEQDPQLVARVRRFENYRRLLYNRKAGPAAQQREEDRWFTEYQPEQMFDVLQEAMTKGAVSLKRDTIPAVLSAKDLVKEMAKGSVKRITQSPTFYRSERDSNDSADPSLYTSFSDQKANDREMTEQHQSAAGEHAEKHEPVSSRLLRPSSSVALQEPLDDQCLRMQQSTPLSGQEHLLAQETESLPQHAQQFSESPMPMLSGPDLADSFLAAIADPFSDQNPKGTRTRVRTLLREVDLSDTAEILRCLVRAYAVARDTRTIRLEHCHPQTGQANRMPLFCAMVQRFMEEHQQGKWWEYPWQHLEDEIASDACLARWWSKHQSQISLPSETLSDVQEAEQHEAEESGSAEWSDQAGAMQSVLRSHRRIHLSQTDAQREERSALAHRVLRRLVRMAISIQQAIVLWEHVTCGCPLYHRFNGREVCALCFPDPQWPEEAIALLRTIVGGEKGSDEASTGLSQPRQEATNSEAAKLCETTPSGWAERDDAYNEALRLLDALTSNAYAAEVFLEQIGDSSSHQVVMRGTDGELICTCPEHIEYLIAQVQNGTF